MPGNQPESSVDDWFSDSLYHIGTISSHTLISFESHGYRVVYVSQKIRLRPKTAAGKIILRQSRTRIVVQLRRRIFRQTIQIEEA